MPELLREDDYGGTEGIDKVTVIAHKQYLHVHVIGSDNIRHDYIFEQKGDGEYVDGLYEPILHKEVMFKGDEIIPCSKGEVTQIEPAVMSALSQLDRFVTVAI